MGDVASSANDDETTEKQHTRFTRTEGGGCKGKIEREMEREQEREGGGGVGVEKPKPQL